MLDSIEVSIIKNKYEINSDFHDEIKQKLWSPSREKEKRKNYGKRKSNFKKTGCFGAGEKV